MTRISRGWALSKQSWQVVRADRSLLVFPVLSAACGLVAALVFFGAGAGIYAATNATAAAVPFVVIGLYVLTYLAIYFGVALTACATRALDGEDTTVAEGLAAARERRGVIASWAGVQLVVGALISMLQALLRESAGGLVSSIFGGLANFAWTVASFFVVPIIALEGLGPKAALERSGSIIKQHWGEGATGAISIGGLVMLVGFLPAVGLGVLAAVAAPSSVPLAVALGVLAVVVLVVAALVQTAMMAVFKVALFRFATEQLVLGGFSQTDLEEAFATKGGGRYLPPSPGAGAGMI